MASGHLTVGLVTPWSHGQSLCGPFTQHGSGMPDKWVWVAQVCCVEALVWFAQLAEAEANTRPRVSKQNYCVFPSGGFPASHHTVHTRDGVLACIAFCCFFLGGGTTHGLYEA